MSRRPRGVGLGAWLARRVLSAADAERLLSDLLDEHARFARSSFWFWSQLLRSLPHLRRARGGIELTARIRLAVRALTRTPGYTFAAVASLALGIGATTALFSIVDAVVLRPLPYPSPERIVRAWADRDDGDITDFSFRVIELRDLEQPDGTFDAVGAEFPVGFTVEDDRGAPLRAEGRRVSARLFDVFGVSPALGRMFTKEEVDAGDRYLAVVSHAFWTRALGADPAALGRPLVLNGDAYTLVGVLPAGYEHISGDVDVFIPYSLGTSGWIARWLDLYGRLADEVDADAARARIDAALRGIGEGDRRSAGWHTRVEPLHHMVVGDVAPIVWSSFAVVALVLLIACLNVANLALARLATRRTELAVRVALGAGRRRIVGELLLESLLVAGVGGIVGIALAGYGVAALSVAAPPEIPRLADASVHGGVLLFSLLVTVTTALAFGVGPSLGAARAPDASVLRSRTGAGTGARGALVVAEIAVASVLLVMSGLVVETVRGLRAEELGFRSEGAAAFRIDVPWWRYGTTEELEAFLGSLRRGLEEHQGVTAAGWGTDLPLSGQGAVGSLNSEDRHRAGVEETVAGLQRRAGPGFVRALGTPVLEGRDFTSDDREGATPVALLGASMARALFPDGDAVGRRVAFGRNPAEDDWMTVVGVVADVRFEEVDVVSMPQVWEAHAQSPTWDVGLVVRGTLAPDALLDAARSVLAELDPGVPVHGATALSGLVDRSLTSRRFTASVFSAFAALALALALAGIYGVLSYLVGTRRRELAVHMALGARATSLQTMVVGRGMRWVAVGLALGLPAAVGTGLLMRQLLYGVRPADPGVLVTIALGIVLASLTATWLPARRASRTDPMAVLRQE